MYESSKHTFERKKFLRFFLPISSTSLLHFSSGYADFFYASANFGKFFIAFLGNKIQLLRVRGVWEGLLLLNKIFFLKSYIKYNDLYEKFF